MNTSTKIYRGAYPHRIESVWGTKGEYHCRTNAGHVYRIEYAPGWNLPDCGDDVRTSPGGGKFVFEHQSSKRRAAKPVEPFMPAKVEPVKAGPIAQTVIGAQSCGRDFIVSEGAYAMGAALNDRSREGVSRRASEAELADQMVPPFSMQSHSNRLTLKLMIAYELGQQAGEAMVPGAVFAGAFQFARQFDCYDDERLLNVFSHAFLAVIDKRFPHGVPTDRVSGVILGEH